MKERKHTSELVTCQQHSVSADKYKDGYHLKRMVLVHTFPIKSNKCIHSSHLVSIRLTMSFILLYQSHVN